jgi:hypothetical protein
VLRKGKGLEPHQPHVQVGLVRDGLLAALKDHEAILADEQARPALPDVPADVSRGPCLTAAALEDRHQATLDKGPCRAYFLGGHFAKRRTIGVQSDNAVALRNFECDGLIHGRPSCVRMARAATGAVAGRMPEVLRESDTTTELRQAFTISTKALRKVQVVVAAAAT